MIVIGISFGIMGLLFGWTSLRHEVAAAESELVIDLQEDLSLLQSILAEPVLQGDHATLEQSLRQYAQGSGVTAVHFSNTKGARIEVINEPIIQHSPGFVIDWFDIRDLSVKTPLIVGGRDYGHVQVTVSALPRIDAAWKQLQYQLLGLAIALIVIYFGIRRVVDSILTPLKAIKKAAAGLATGEQPVQIDEMGSPELRSMIATMNRLAIDLHASRTTLRASEMRYRTLVENAPQAILVHANGNVSYANQSALDLLGADDIHSLAKHRLCELIAEDALASIGGNICTELPIGQRVPVTEIEIVCLDGQQVWAEVAGIVTDFDGHAAMLLILSDITQRRRAEERVHLLAAVYAHAREGITITRLNGEIVDVNPRFCEITGYTAAEVIGKNPRLLSSGRQDAEFYRGMWESIRNTGHWQGEIWNKRKNGDIYPEMLSITTLQDDRQDTGYYLAIFTDITDLKAHQARLEDLAHFDALTHLPNRTLLSDRMQTAMAQARRSEKTLAVCYLDLDGFKPVNDVHGHRYGDLLLIEAANRIKQAVRGGDTVARLGGDEFVLLLGDVGSMALCELALSRVIHSIEEPIFIEGKRIVVSASIGVTLFPADDDDADTLLRHADQALYTAKGAGRNCYRFFDITHDQGVRVRRENIIKVNAAIAEGQLQLYYQPKVDMRHGRVIGAEALIRWQHPEYGLLLPGQFLAGIEKTDADIAIGNWVIQEALKQMHAWRGMDIDVAISVNISPYHLEQANFVAQLKAFLDSYPDLPKQRLQIEILESAALEDIQHLTTLISECQSLGVDFALDDFGTGYSSLTYLKRLPATTLKVDQSFIRDMLHDSDDMSIVDGVIGLAQAFRREVVAEGVETIEHGVMLLQLGCDHAQGYGIARPMPADRYPEWLNTWQSDSSWKAAASVRLPREDIAILTAENDHRRWVSNLHALLETRDSPVPPLDIHQCRFGKWYYGQGCKRYGDLNEFKQIESLHCQLHAIGEKLIEQHRSGHIKDVTAHQEDLDQASNHLSAAMNVLLIALAMQ